MTSEVSESHNAAGSSTSHCNVIVVKDGVVHANVFINGETVTERAAHAETLLCQIVGYMGVALDFDEMAAICEDGYYKFPNGDSVCITWSGPGASSYPDPDFSLKSCL